CIPLTTFSPLDSLQSAAHPHPPPSFPTRRSSDLASSAGASPKADTPGSPRTPSATAWARAPTSRPTRIRRAQVQSAKEWFSLSRSEEHTSELQSPDHLVCRLLLEKKNNTRTNSIR